MNSIAGCAGRRRRRPFYRSPTRETTSCEYNRPFAALATRTEFLPGDWFASLLEARLTKFFTKISLSFATPFAAAAANIVDRIDGRYGRYRYVDGGGTYVGIMRASKIQSGAFLRCE